MGITAPIDAPVDLQPIKEALGRFSLFTNNVALSIRNSAKSNTFKIALPHKIYRETLKGISLSPLDNPEFYGWRYLLLSGREAFASAEFSIDKKTGMLEFSCIKDDLTVKRTVEALNYAQSRKRVKKSGLNYELNLLEIPEIYLIALWLRSEEDLIIPILVGFDPIREFQAFSKTELAKYILERFKDRLDRG